MAYKRISPQPVVEGGTGVQSNTAYSVLTGGTTATGAIQSVSGVGTSGQVLTSNGAAALPTWQAAGGGGGVTLGTMQSPTSGTTVTFTGISASAKHIIFNINRIRCSGADTYEFLMGDAGGLDATAYAGLTLEMQSTAGTQTLEAWNTFIPVTVNAGAANQILAGKIELTLMDSATNLWDINIQMADVFLTRFYWASGKHALSDTLTQLQLRITGASTFTSGNVNIAVFT